MGLSKNQWLPLYLLRYSLIWLLIDFFIYENYTVLWNIFKRIYRKIIVYFEIPFLLKFQFIFHSERTENIFERGAKYFLRGSQQSQIKTSQIKTASFFNQLIVTCHSYRISFGRTLGLFGTALDFFCTLLLSIFHFHLRHIWKYERLFIWWLHLRNVENFHAWLRINMW